jgi:FkbM family methyltransferase
LLVKDYIAEVRALLAKSTAEVAAWERSVFDRLAGDKAGRVVLCGAGGLGRRTLSGLRKAGLSAIAFADNNLLLAGKSIEGVPVYSAKDAVEKFGKDSVFVLTIWGAHSSDRLAQRKQQWRSLGCETVVSFMPLCWKYPQFHLPHYSCDLPHKVFEQAGRIAAVAGLWADDQSRKEFVAQLRWRSEMDYDGLPEPVSGAPYFPADLFELLPDERLVDCGAYDGDTLADFLNLTSGRFGKFWALEPDPGNFAKLSALVSKLEPAKRSKIELLMVAACERAQTLHFSADATAASAVIARGGIEVEGQPLDSVLAGADPTFLKMDIEGAEVSALRGAQDVLRRCRPVLAVCIYHLQEHLWEIPEMLAIMLKDYSFFLRPHDCEGWDLVCYAVPRERVRCPAGLVRRA